MNETRRHFDFQQPHSMFGTWIGVVLLFIVFALFVWVVLGAIPRGDTYEEKRAKARMEKLEQLHKDATAALTSYAWVDKNKGTVRIPVERAMELTMADLASKKPMAAGPIANALHLQASPLRNRPRRSNRCVGYTGCFVHRPAQRNQILLANRCRRLCNHRLEVRCRWLAKLRRHEHFRSDQPNETLRKKCGDDF